MEAAGSCSYFIHRTFDVCADPFEALKKSAEFGRGYNPDIRSGGRLPRRMRAPLKGSGAATDQNRSDSRRVTILAGAGVTLCEYCEIAKKQECVPFICPAKRLLGERYALPE